MESTLSEAMWHFTKVMFDSLTKKEMCYTNIVQATKEYVMNPQSYLSILNLYYRGITFNMSDPPELTIHLLLYSNAFKSTEVPWSCNCAFERCRMRANKSDRSTKIQKLYLQRKWKIIWSDRKSTPNSVWKVLIAIFWRINSPGRTLVLYVSFDSCWKMHMCIIWLRYSNIIKW